MNELEALRWIIKQRGINLIVEDDGKINLRFGYLFNVTGDDIIDVVKQLQDAQTAYDNNKHKSGFCRNG